MINLTDTIFRRMFSVSMYKNLKLGIGEMSFFKDFVHDSRGDLYPVLDRSETCTESVKDGVYEINGGSIERMFCRFFPYASYEISAALTNGTAGFTFRLPKSWASVILSRETVTYTCENRVREVSIPDQRENEITLIVQCRPAAFDIYLKNGRKPEFVCTFEEETFRDSDLYAEFSNGTAALTVSGHVTVTAVQAYSDNGISIADIRPIKYENGEVITEQGKIFFTASVRMQRESFQGVFSWIPTTTTFEMTGAVFYDCGDGRWRGCVAPVMIYNRNKKQWYVWVVSSFEHILAHAAFDGDPRFGVNIIDVQIMEKAPNGADISSFTGFRGDEDPDLLYDEKRNRWLMAICRLDPKNNRYVYVFFESDDPFEGYTCLGKGYDGSETGGSFLSVKDDVYFICGNDEPGKVSDYRIYSKNGMKKAVFDYPDGGFRGWGSVFPIRMGSRTRYFWLTFDRHKGSDFTWSYGNLYCFEADIYKQ